MASPTLQPGSRRPSLQSPFLTPISLAIHGPPIFRLQLTLFYLDAADRLVQSGTTTIKGHHFLPSLASAAALELAKCCLSEGEVVMLMEQKKYGEGAAECVLNRKYVVGLWVHEGDAAANNLHLMEVEQKFMARRVRGRVSGRVHVLETREADL